MDIKQKASSRRYRPMTESKGRKIVNPTANAVLTGYSTTDDIVRSLSLVKDEIAETAAKIDEQQVADLGRHLSQPGRVFVAGAGRSGA